MRSFKCSYCKSESLSRIPRKNWMRIIPFSERYECKNCQAEILLSMGVPILKLHSGHSKLINLNNVLNNEL